MDDLFAAAQVEGRNQDFKIYKCEKMPELLDMDRNMRGGSNNNFGGPSSYGGASAYGGGGGSGGFGGR